MQSPGDRSLQIAKISLAVAIDNPVSLAIARTWTVMGMVRGHACSAARVSCSVAHLLVRVITVLFYPIRVIDEPVQAHPSGLLPERTNP